jgi:hypothetical protein
VVKLPSAREGQPLECVRQLSFELETRYASNWHQIGVTVSASCGIAENFSYPHFFVAK